MRRALLIYLRKSGIGANFHYPAVYSHPYYRRNGYRKVRLSNEETYENTCITLPCYVDMKKGDVIKTANAIKTFFGTH